jgi:predicted RNA polymerase sigma factor
MEARVALTLREVCGLTTEEIARAYLTPAPTIAQLDLRPRTGWAYPGRHLRHHRRWRT